MTEANSSSPAQKEPTPHPARKALDVMVGTLDLKGRDFTTKEAIRSQPIFEWTEGGFFLIHKSNFDYAGRRFAGIEYIGYDEKNGHLKTHVYSTQDPGPLGYTWEVYAYTFTNLFGGVGSDNHYKGKFSEDKNTLPGQWEWPGGG